MVRTQRGPLPRRPDGASGQKPVSGSRTRPTIDHFPTTRATCEHTLSPADGFDYIARQVFDLPAPAPLVVTEHRAHRCRCAARGTTTRAAFPEAVSAPVRYGARIAKANPGGGWS